MEAIESKITAIQQGNSKLLDGFIKENEGLVWMVINKLPEGFNNDHDELFNLGLIGIWNAVMKFDVTLGYSFSTFAIPHIKKEIYHHFDCNTNTVKVPMFRKYLNQQIEASIDEGKTDWELNQTFTNSQLEIYYNALTQRQNITWDDDGECEIEYLAPSEENGGDKNIDELIKSNHLLEAIRSLPQRHQLVINYYYGLNNKEPLNCTKIAKKFGKELGVRSRQRIYQILQESLKILKEKI